VEYTAAEDDGDEEDRGVGVRLEGLKHDRPGTQLRVGPRESSY